MFIFGGGEERRRRKEAPRKECKLCYLFRLSFACFNEFACLQILLHLPLICKKIVSKCWPSEGSGAFGEFLRLKFY